MNKRFSKFMLTSASAVALLAAYPAVAQNANEAGFDLPAITAEAATPGNAFIRVVRALPAAADITSADAASIRAARASYNALPAREKAMANVTRWAGYLAEKEAALPVDHVRDFLLESRALPNVAEIRAMNATEFATARVNLQAARASYAQLTDAQKAETDVARWAGYLTVKEDNFGITFILAARDLPSMNAISEMDADELEEVLEDIASVRELYDALSSVAKADSEVNRWIGYVDQKEEAAEEAAVVELDVEVVSVNDIDVDGVEVTFEAATEDNDEANVVVLDNQGNIVETESTLVAEGQTTAIFDFVRPFAANYEFKGVWTVNGVEYNFDAITQFNAIVDVAETDPLNEVRLLSALNNAGIVNVNNDVLSEYASAITNADPVVEDLEDIQQVINETNNRLGKQINKAAAAKAVNESQNQIQLLNALSSNFERVNRNWIVTYDAALTGNQTYDQIQTAIDNANVASLDAVTPTTAAAQANLTALIETWMKPDNPDTPNNTPKADAIAVSKLKEAELKVAEANTANRLYNALVEYANTLDDKEVLDVADIKTENKQSYFDVRAERTPVEIVEAGNAQSVANTKAKVLENLNKVDVNTPAANVASLLAQYKALDNNVTAPVNNAYAEAYKKDIIENYTEAEPVVVINAAEVQNLLVKVNAVENAAALLAAVNTATTPAQMSTALVALEAGQETNTFTNLPSQAKLEVADIVLATRNDIEATETTKASEFVGATEVLAAVETAMETRSSFLYTVNNESGSIAEMRTNLTNEDLFPEFFALGVAEKTTKAELVYNALQTRRADDNTNNDDFTTIAQIKAAAGL